MRRLVVRLVVLSDARDKLRTAGLHASLLIVTLTQHSLWHRTLTHPYSIFIWQPARHPANKGQWIEPVQVYTEHYARYLANLIHQDTRSVIKVVRFGLTLACYPDEKMVAFVERQIVRQQIQ